MHLQSTGLDRASDLQKNNELISYNQAEIFFREQEQKDYWLDWCIENEVYHYYTQDYIDIIARELKKIDQSLYRNSYRLDPVNGSASAKRIIEIGAGRGRLSHGLQNKGISIFSTDPEAGNKDVRQLSAAEALQKYNPEVVIGAWLPVDAGIEAMVLDYPTVKYFLYICQVFNGAVGSEKIWQTNKWEITSLPEADKYSLSRYDFTDILGKIVKHSRTLLLKKTRLNMP